MVILFSLKKITILLSTILLIILGAGIYYKFNLINNSIIYVDDLQNNMLTMKIQELFEKRNHFMLDKNISDIKSLYNQNVRNGRWACEHALKKMKCLHSWSEKQGITFKDINSLVIVRNIKKKGSVFSANLMVSTEYRYVYKDSKKKLNSFRIGTYHSLDLIPSTELIFKDLAYHSTSIHIENNLQIAKEWYTDPFADSLHPGKMKNQDIKNLILSGKTRDTFQINRRRKKALNYAEKYCGAASLPGYSYNYNSNYKNYNNLGGDCANFASQILYEGGDFTKNTTWNYYRGAGSKSWVNAHSFNNYMVYSGRASLIAYGKYEKVLRQSYKLLPGDYIAYEKKDRVVHISVVSGYDTKGYTLVVSHNTDRYNVPWDLGWNNNKIKFRLIHVHY